MYCVLTSGRHPPFPAPARTRGLATYLTLTDEHRSQPSLNGSLSLVRSLIFHSTGLASLTRGGSGDVVGLRALGTNIIVLNSLDTINDLLDKRGTNYSHRPVFTVVGELMELDNVPRFLLYAYDETVLIYSLDTEYASFAL